MIKNNVATDVKLYYTADVIVISTQLILNIYTVNEEEKERV